MAKFFLHIRDGDHLIEDHDGAVFPDLEAARHEALLSARELLGEMMKRGDVLNGRCFEICDDTGQVLATVPFRDVLKLH